MSTNARAERPKKRKQAPLGRIVWTNSIQIDAAFKRRDAGMFWATHEPDFDEEDKPHLLLDLSNPEAVVEAVAREICFVKDVYVRPIEIDRKAARAVLAAFGHTAKPGPTPARKVAGKEGR